jgi:hypothetical protein
MEKRHSPNRLLIAPEEANLSIEINMIEQEFWQIRVEEDVILPYNAYSVQAADRAAWNPALTCFNLLYVRLFFP